MIDTFIRECNYDGQDFVDVLAEIEDDLNSIDKGVLLKVRNYKVNPQGKLVGSRIREVARLNPIWFFELRDRKGRLGYTQETEHDKPRRAYVTVDNRHNLVYDKIDKKTGIENIEVHYRYNSAEGSTYYNRDEVIYKNKFKKHGFSPLYSLHNKILSLIEMDYYIRQEYSEGKPSKKMLAFKVADRDRFKEAFEDYDTKMKKNPHRIHPLIVQQSAEAKQPIAEVIDFMKPLVDMDFTEMRARFITDIGACYGVSPMFMNDMSTGGGLNNEGLQITVTNEAVEGDKDLFNRCYIAPIMLELGITDWDVNLYPSEEEDEISKQEVFAKQLENATAFLDLKGEVSFLDGEFIFKENESLKKKESGGGGGMPPFMFEKSDVQKENFIDVDKPFSGYEDYSACMIDQTQSGRTKKSASKICSYLQARGSDKAANMMVDKECLERGLIKEDDLEDYEDGYSY